jgi:hypothetical protein
VALQVIAGLLVAAVLGVIVAWQVRGDVDRRLREGEDPESLSWRSRWFRGH